MNQNNSKALWISLEPLHHSKRGQPKQAIDSNPSLKKWSTQLPVIPPSDHHRHHQIKLAGLVTPPSPPKGQWAFWGLLGVHSLHSFFPYLSTSLPLPFLLIDGYSSNSDRSIPLELLLKKDQKRSELQIHAIYSNFESMQYRVCSFQIQSSVDQSPLSLFLHNLRQALLFSVCTKFWLERWWRRSSLNTLPPTNRHRHLLTNPTSYWESSLPII